MLYPLATHFDCELSSGSPKSAGVGEMPTPGIITVLDLFKFVDFVHWMRHAPYRILHAAHGRFVINGMIGDNVDPINWDLINHNFLKLVI